MSKIEFCHFSQRKSQFKEEEGVRTADFQKVVFSKQLKEWIFRVDFQEAAQRVDYQQATQSVEKVRCRHEEK